MNRATFLIGFAAVLLLVGCAAGGCGPKRITSPVVIAPAAENDPLARQFQQDPVAFLEQGLKWYDGFVKDYTCSVTKLERIDPAAKDFLPEQKMECKFKENPFSVFTRTVINPRGAEKALYVEGQWDGKMKACTGGFLPIIVTTDPRGSMARANTLRFIDQFGFKRSLVTIVGSFRTGQAEGIQRLQVRGTGKIGEREVLVVESWIKEKAPTGKPAGKGKSHPTTQPGQPAGQVRFEFPHTRIYLDREWRIPLGVDIWDVNDIERGNYRLFDVKFNVALTDADFTLKANGM